MKSYPKIGKVKLEGADYQAWKNLIHELDVWRCKVCQKVKPLTVHHLVKRSRVRLDVVDNAISACVPCHDQLESGAIVVAWIDVARRILHVTRVTAGNKRRFM